MKTTPPTPNQVADHLVHLIAARKAQAVRFWVVLAGSLITILVWKARPTEPYWIAVGLVAAHLPEMAAKITELVWRWFLREVLKG